MYPFQRGLSGEGWVRWRLSFSLPFPAAGSASPTLALPLKGGREERLPLPLTCDADSRARRPPDGSALTPTPLPAGEGALVFPSPLEGEGGPEPVEGPGEGAHGPPGGLPHNVHHTFRGGGKNDSRSPGGKCLQHEERGHPGCDSLRAGSPHSSLRARLRI